MLKCNLIGLLLLQAPGAEPGKDPQRGQPQTLAQSQPTPSSSTDHADRAWAELHEVELRDDWDRLQAGRTPVPIEPLS